MQGGRRAPVYSFCSLRLEHLSKHSWLLWKLPNPDELIRARGGGSWRLEPARSSPGGPVANVRGGWASAGEGGPCAAGPGPGNPGGDVCTPRTWQRVGVARSLDASWEPGAAQPGSEREQTCGTGTSSILRAALWEPGLPAGASLHVVAAIY